MDPFVGEIRVFAGNYPPAGWLLCNGQVLPIQQYNVLFSIIGAAYGGNGTSTFGLPNLAGRAPVGQGQGPNLTARILGEAGGVATVTLTETETPSHNHGVDCQTSTNQTTPTNNIWAGAGGRAPKTYGTTLNTPMNPQIVAPVGGGQPHNNMQPCLAMNFIIATEGEYPVRQS